MAKQMRYVGAIEHLKGKTALVRVDSGGKTVAQFDDMNLTLTGKPWKKVAEDVSDPHCMYSRVEDVDPPTPPAGALGFGWHEFNESDFEAD